VAVDHAVKLHPPPDILSSSFAYGNAAPYTLGYYGLGLCYKYLRTPKVYFCPSSNYIEWASANFDANWADPSRNSGVLQNYLYGWYVIRGRQDTDPNNNLDYRDDKPLDTHLAHVANKALVSCTSCITPAAPGP
jgi:hypothetical protein